MNVLVLRTHVVRVGGAAAIAPAAVSDPPRCSDELARDRRYSAASSGPHVFNDTGHSKRTWAARLDSVRAFPMGAR